MTQNTPQWEEEFDEKFTKLLMPPEYHVGVPDDRPVHPVMEGVKSFIRTQIEAAEQRGREKIIAQLEGEMFSDPNQAGQFALHAAGYNEALEDAIALIRAPKGEDAE